MALGGLGPPRPQGSASAMPACHLRRQGTRLTSTVVTLTDVQSRPSSRFLSEWRLCPGVVCADPGPHRTHHGTGSFRATSHSISCQLTGNAWPAYYPASGPADPAGLTGCREIAHGPRTRAQGNLRDCSIGSTIGQRARLNRRDRAIPNFTY